MTNDNNCAFCGPAILLMAKVSEVEHLMEDFGKVQTSLMSQKIVSSRISQT